MSTPFLDQALVRGSLYSNAARLSRRTQGLRAAKIAGPDVATAITRLLKPHLDGGGIVLDIGCGRGTTTARIAAELQPRRLIALDASAALLAVAASRVPQAETVVADFHRLPFGNSQLDAAVAAFCLYHSPHPGEVIAEIARCLRQCGAGVLVTKSLDSYAELDEIIANCGLDPQASAQPSLYSSFHSGNIEKLLAQRFGAVTLHHEQHIFRFADFEHLGAYLATTPKYELGEITGDAAAITQALRQWRPDRPTIMRSTVSYAVAVKR
jgi:ubiquinone/menaquinone biosynthesis C-methylase UbiE